MPSSSTRWLRAWQLALLIAFLAFWHLATSPTLLPPIYFDDPNKAAFFFGEPLKVFERTWDWFTSGTIYPHLWVTLLETLLAFVLGTSDRQLLRHVYVPSAMSWVFASLHNSVGLAFVGAVVGEYLGSSRGVGYLILQAEGTFDINAVFAGILVLTAFALLLDWAVSLAERRLLVWQPRGGETEKM